MAKMSEARIPFTKMSYTPDVPSTALGPNEYNSGYNVETDVRGIRSTLGDQAILATVPGTATYMSGGFRADGNFWFIVATTEGYWWANKGTGWQDITPVSGPFVGQYAQNTNITEAWNGTIPFFNDTVHPPMVWLEGDSKMIIYSNAVPLDISNITYQGPTTQRITLAVAQNVAPYSAGEQIVISGVNNFYNGVFTVVTSTTTYIDYTAVPGGGYSSGGTVSAKYAWNYNPNWNSYYAKFLRIYNSPNVGSILVAGDLVANVVASFQGNISSGNATVISSGASTNYLGGVISGTGIPTGTLISNVTPGVSYLMSNVATATTANLTMNVNYTQEFPVTVQWSQAFGLNQAPLTWVPTITNIANQLEVPLRGPAIDAFPCNGQFFLCSYWDTVVFSPLNYATTNTPILGVRLFNQGRGLLTSNTWGNTDKLVYGIDARDIWVFDGSDFKGIGNQRVKNWFFDQLDQQYYDRVFMEVNTQKNQIEIYYPTSAATNGVPNKMISYRYDIDAWNAPRDVSNATMGCESPVWSYNGSAWVNQLATRTIVYARGTANVSIAQKDQGFSFIGNTAISSNFRRDNVKLLPDYSGHTLVHRILPEVVNIDNFGIPVYPSTGNISVKIEGANSVGSAPANTTAVTMSINTDNPWTQIDQNAYRVNTIELSNTSNVNAWICSATTWQFTQVEDDR